MRWEASEAEFRMVYWGKWLKKVAVYALAPLLYNGIKVMIGDTGYMIGYHLFGLLCC